MIEWAKRGRTRRTPATTIAAPDPQRGCQAWPEASRVPVPTPGVRRAEGEPKGQGVAARRGLRRANQRGVGEGSIAGLLPLDEAGEGGTRAGIHSPVPFVRGDEPPSQADLLRDRLLCSVVSESVVTADDGFRPRSAYSVG